MKRTNKQNAKVTRVSHWILTLTFIATILFGCTEKTNEPDGSQSEVTQSSAVQSEASQSSEVQSEASQSDASETETSEADASESDAVSSESSEASPSDSSEIAQAPNTPGKNPDRLAWEDPESGVMLARDAKYTPTDFEVEPIYENPDSKSADKGKIVGYEIGVEDTRFYSSMDADVDQSMLQRIASASENFLDRYGKGNLTKDKLPTGVYIFQFDLAQPRNVQESMAEMPEIKFDWTIYENLIYAWGGRHMNAGLVRELAKYEAVRNGLEVPDDTEPLQKAGDVDNGLVQVSDEGYPELKSMKLEFTSQLLSPYWVEPIELAMLRSLNADFTKWLIQEKGESFVWRLARRSSAVEMEFDEELSSLKRAWLQERGSKMSLQTPISPVRFPAVVQWRIAKEEKDDSVIDVIKTRYIDYDYDKNHHIIWGNDQYGLTRNVDEVRMTDLQIERIREIAQPYMKVPTNPIPAHNALDSDISWYDNDTKSIYLSISMSTAHEYVHTINAQEEFDYENRWMIEGMANYLDWITKDPAYHYNYFLEANDPYDYQKVYRRYYEKWKGEDFPTDIQKFDVGFVIDARAAEMMEVVTVGSPMSMEVFFGHQKEDSVGHSYESAAALCQYIVKHYGIEKFFAAYNDYDNFEQIIGKPYKEVRAEWKQYMDTMFADFQPHE